MRSALILLLIGASLQAAIFPDAEWQPASPAQVGLDEAKLKLARDYALTGGGSGYVIRGGKLAYSWGDSKQLYDLKSTSKSIGVTLLGLALKDGKVQLDQKATKYHPTFGVPPEANKETGWLDSITLRHLANQTAGFEKPGGYQPLLFEPGTKWHYSDCGPNWLAECLTLVYQKDLNKVMFERVFTPLGIQKQDIRWRFNQYRPREINGIIRREFGAGFHANVNAMARLGYLYLQKGKWKDEQIIPASFVELCSKPAKENLGLPEHDQNHGNASEHYSLLWWNNGDGKIPNVPGDTYWSWGLYDSLIVVIPSLDMVIARAGKSWARPTKDHYDPLVPFLQPLTAAAASSAPYPMSSVIKGITWAPKEEILRLARGSDNWPTAWAGDNSMFTAYGDGHGFQPFMPRKLSLGMAQVFGLPPKLVTKNIPTTPEFIGDGEKGYKASGLLMLDNTLYMLQRNRGPSRLLQSTDRARTWSDTGVSFEQSFGCPTFLSFGPNGSRSRDNFIYIYSLDGSSAYKPADQIVLARVPKPEITHRTQYELFKELWNDEPIWTKNIEERGGVFTFPGNCYRSGITYNAALKRYLWCQVLPHSTHPQGPRFQGGFGIYDAPEPWGPWTTAFFTTNWDVGPGESSSFPPNWISEDGKTLHLLFSGDDCFSVRKATLEF